MGFWHTNGSPNLGQKTKPYNNKQKKKKKKKKRERERERENLQNCRLCCPGWSLNKTERKLKEGQVPRQCEGIKKKMEHEGDNYTNRD